MMAQMALSPRQKAAVIVRLLMDGNDDMNLSALDRDHQAALAQEMAGMDLIDRTTRDAVITEFCDSLESVGVTFPGGLDGTLDMLGSSLSDDTANHLRRIAALTGKGDPWERIAALPVDKIIALANQEAVEIVALMFSKLPVSKASEAFTALGPVRARTVAHAMSMTGGVTIEALHRVGQVLLRAADALPRPAIEKPAVDRVGAILNFASAEIRDSVLQGLDDDDAEFAVDVRKAIFTFAHIPTRIQPRDVPRIVREIETPVLLRALAGATENNAISAEFILTNISQRMAEGLRDEMGSVGKQKPRDIEDAMSVVVAAIRDLEAAGELVMVVPDDEG
ncbi:MAG: FliG C-terminal domain-containing protein [Paracoccus sp. (in: a-proteobacteria)]|nr:FliG C-terminal domain-containing protein [Paracoccus sp. (in: a-proteobacteria)]